MLFYGALIKPLTNSLKRQERLFLIPINEVYVSAVSLWEITIKVGLGKLDVSLVEILEELKKASFVVLQIDSVYLQKLLDLPSIHKDPFDRLIIATAQAEGFTLITADENIQGYDVEWIW